jgi:hypothetical protein
MNLLEDTHHWHNLQPPLAPNEYEVEIYRHHIKGLVPVCLLGMTKPLIPLCDFMVDANPVRAEKKVIKCDWNDLKERSSVVIGDGVLNLCGVELAHKMLTLADKAIFRVFLKKLEGMKYAKYFPKEFLDADMVIPTQKDVAIVIWSNV